MKVNLPTTEPQAYAMATLTGWGIARNKHIRGQPRFLQNAQFKIIPSDKCSSFNGLPGSNLMFCANDRALQGACQVSKSLAYLPFELKLIMNL